MNLIPESIQISNFKNREGYFPTRKIQSDHFSPKNEGFYARSQI